ncbi:MAG: tRNA preQ1(34) S-adenosylmethionine ribosyltransferase-isomerase QueA [Candidatus Kerfeldbacteria bacterium]|nr:tRNA preQ1(34) S-adenosylmethionine ribosyltransferase-isomerase QueA [Candidatus Kerfeldbacteria bacterium]
MPVPRRQLPGAAYDYVLDPARIALRPARPRDGARLLVYDRRRQTVVVDTFRQLAKYLPPQAVLVFNDTKVVPARVVARKSTGGRLVLLVTAWTAHRLTVLADRAIAAGQVLSIQSHHFRVIGQRGSTFTLRPLRRLNVLALLTRHGRMPLPPYLHRSPLSEAERQQAYQTVFARTAGSVAAPTASLHFTRRLVQSLRRHGVATTTVTLHVGLGTFAPLTRERLRSGTLHQEHYAITRATAARLNQYRRAGRPIIAVGTTAARTLESAVRRGKIVPGHGITDIFIRPGYRWTMVDGLITNFHVPRSSLLMLVAAMVGRKQVLKLYAQARRRQFRFLSFGDGMLIK